MTELRQTLSYEPLLDAPERATIGDHYVKALAIVLMGYALFGRTWAYMGIPPIFVGELMVIFGMLTILSTPRWTRMFRTSQGVILVPFMLWGLLRTVPFFKEYLLDAARDGVIWGYGCFAFYIAATLLAEPARLKRLLAWYDPFTRIFVSLVPFIWLVAHFGEPYLPNLPWAQVPIVSMKGGDVQVHLAGILAFWAAGLGAPVKWRYVILLTLDVGICGVTDRGGLLAFLFVVVICVLMRPQSLAPWRLFSMIFIGLLILAITGIEIAVPGGKDRPISFGQFMDNIFSVGGSGKTSGLDATKQWRINWWNDIIDYTVYGPYFWGGKGFGPNLANEDGYQVTADNSLRSPHNIHMTVLARSGVLGAALWAGVNLIWAFGIAWGHLTARRRGRQLWAAMFLFLGCYWAAFIINGSFDVFLEGPMGGIWFWTIYGVGVASLWMYKKEPGALSY